MDKLYIYVVFDHPRDFSSFYVVKRDLIQEGKVIRDQIFIVLSTDLTFLRNSLWAQGLTMMTRHPEDDPVILETWL